MGEDFLWALWNGVTAWPLLLLRVFGIWDRFPVYHVARDGGWYRFGFLIGAGSPFLGTPETRGTQDVRQPYLNANHLS